MPGVIKSVLGSTRNSPCKRSNPVGSRRAFFAAVLIVYSGYSPRPRTAPCHARNKFSPCCPPPNFFVGYYGDGHQIGTYTRRSDDSWSDFQNGLFFGNAKDPGLAGRAQATKNLIYIVAGLNLTVPAAIFSIEVATGAAFESAETYFITVRSVRPYSHLSSQNLLKLLEGKNKLIEEFFNTGRLPEGVNSQHLKVYMEAALRRLAEGKDISLRDGGNVQWNRIITILKYLGEL